MNTEHQSDWDQLNLVNEQDTLAEQYGAQGQYRDAEDLYRQMFAIYEQPQGPNHLATSVSGNNPVYIQQSQNKMTEAEQLMKRALALLEQKLGPDHPAVAHTLNSLGKFYLKQQRHAEATPQFQRALSIFERTLGPNHPQTQAVRANVQLASQPPVNRRRH